MKVQKKTPFASLKKKKTTTAKGTKDKPAGRRQPASSAAAAARTSSKFDRKKRVRDEEYNVDAWDAGAIERNQDAQARKKAKSKKLRFEPVPATFQLPTREEQLRKQMGDFAGPLLGTLWEGEAEETRNLQVKFVDRKDRGKGFGELADESEQSAMKRRKGKHNNFSVLASSDEDEDVMPGSAQKGQKSNTLFKPATFDIAAKPNASTSSWFPSAATTTDSSRSLFKPPTIDASQLLKQSSSSANSVSSVKVEFKAATFNAFPSAVPSSSFSSVASNAPSSTNSGFGVQFRPPTFQASAQANTGVDWDDL